MNPLYTKDGDHGIKIGERFQHVFVIALPNASIESFCFGYSLLGVNCMNILPQFLHISIHIQGPSPLVNPPNFW
jgi:hypothetical protein